MTRIIDGLLRAWPSEAPRNLPKDRLRGAKAKGMTFERSVGRELGQGALGALWWQFLDRRGPGCCQTDWIIEGRRGVLVLECKLGQNWEAWKQLEGLYAPVVGKASGKEVLGIQVCRYLRKEFSVEREEIVLYLEDAISAARCGLRPVLHWSGLGPLRRPSRSAPGDRAVVTAGCPVVGM